MSKDASPPGAGSESHAINNTPFRRLLTLLALKTTARLFRRQGACIPISKGLIVKCDFLVDLTEAATMRFVADNTSIPVPKVWCSFEHKGRAYIVMERIDGHYITKDWNTRSQESKDKLLAQLKTMIQELRSLQPPPGSGVESCIGGSMHDSRISRPERRFGPFKTIHEFHLWLRGGLQPSEVKMTGLMTQEDYDAFMEMAKQQDGPWPRTVFTHADLNPTNILVRGDEVVSIIDWEFSGWYPHYWEYTAAFCTQILATGWQELLGSFLEPCPEELKMEMTRQMWWGET
jgi:serine/threonine protein kinase